MKTANTGYWRGHFARALSWIALCALSGCPDKPQTVVPSSLLDPVALDAQLVLVDQRGDRAFILGVAAAERDQRKLVPLPHGTLSAMRRNAQNEALVLAAGRRAEQDKPAEPAVLSALDAAGNLRRYELGNPFDSLTQSDDGRYALLFKAGKSMRLLDNPNEIAIVDLDAAPDAGAVSLRTLRSFGDSPQRILFSPMMNIVGEARRLAVVLSPSNVTLIDLNHLDRRETTVQLSAAAGGALQPADVSFNPTQPELYVRANSSDLLVFNLRERRADESPSDDGEAHNDFRPFIDQLAIGGEPSDVQLYTQAGATRVLVLAPDVSQAVSVDPDTSQVTSIGLPIAASSALVFEAGSPRDRERATRALLYRPGLSSVAFLDLADVETRGTRNLEQLNLERPVASLFAMPDQGQVMVLHAGNGVSLIDLTARTVSLITSVAELLDARFDAARGALWFGPRAQPYVGLLDLQTGATSEILLDDDVQQLIPIFAARQVAVLHPGEDGVLSLIDADHPTRESTRILRGFLQ